MAVSAGGTLAQGVVQGITIGGGGVLGGATYGTMNAIGDLRQLADFSRHILTCSNPCRVLRIPL